MIEYGEGFGRAYQKVPALQEQDNEIRKERSIVTTIGGEEVTVILRDKIVAFDPYLNLVRAALYATAKAHSGRVFFPVPPVSDRIKEALLSISGGS